MRILIVGDRFGAVQDLPENLNRGQLGRIYDTQREFVAQGRAAAYTEVLRCVGPMDLIRVVKDAAYRHRQPVNDLDILDHGAPGTMQLGRGTLFDVLDGKVAGADTFVELTKSISPVGTLRLLGCKTALGRRGRDLLRQLGNLASYRIRVCGTIGRVRPVAFRLPGYTGHANFLFSSDAAIDRSAPTYGQRVENLKPL